jgi:restriction system protein
LRTLLAHPAAKVKNVCSNIRLFHRTCDAYLADHPEGAPARDVHDAAAEALHLSDNDRAESCRAASNAFTKIGRDGHATVSNERVFPLVSGVVIWQLTEQGRAFASKHPAPLSPEILEKLITEHKDVRVRPAADIEGPAAAPVESPVPERATASADDRLEQAMAELRQAVTAELLEMLSQVSPECFETIVLDFLPEMGYGTN